MMVTPASFRTLAVRVTRSTCRASVVGVEKAHSFDSNQQRTYLTSATTSGGLYNTASEFVTRNTTFLSIRQFSSGKRDFYEVLGVPRNSDKAEIKKAYYKKAKQYHPDANQDDKTAADKFKQVTEAYETLSDNEKRKLYDQFGHAGVDPNFQQGNPFGGAGGFNFNDGSFHFSQTGGSEEIDPQELFDMFL
jgi:hypothetical protein